MLSPTWPSPLLTKAFRTMFLTTPKQISSTCKVWPATTCMQSQPSLWIHLPRKTSQWVNSHGSSYDSRRNWEKDSSERYSLPLPYFLQQKGDAWHIETSELPLALLHIWELRDVDNSTFFNACLCCWGKWMVGFREPRSAPVRLLLGTTCVFLNRWALQTFFCSLSVSPFMTLYKRPGDVSSDCFTIFHGCLKHLMAVTHL